ncbi:MAG: flagellar hook-basal body complex protein FliE [candidate division Zixibacteria bacterium]|nr:flagellar hook-basal body complex protein FliE [candidate division Zixibacteria bacterium]
MSGVTPITTVIEGVYNRPELPGLESATPKPGADPLGEVFSGVLDTVNELHTQAGVMEESLYSNDPVELHRVMIAAEQAGVATDLLLQIRNRLIEGYQTLMRMPV